jgi:hypothetical protein
MKRAMLLIGLLALTPSLVAAQGKIEQLRRQDATFDATGPKGNLKLVYEQCSIINDGGQFALKMAAPNKSKVTAQFDIAGIPFLMKRAEFEMTAKAPTGSSLCSVSVNGISAQGEIRMMHSGYEDSVFRIGKYLQRGANSVEVQLEGGQLVIRQMTVLTPTSLPWYFLFGLIIAFVIITLATSRLLFFELLWWGGRGLRPIAAAWLSVFLGSASAVIIAFWCIGRFI